MGIIVKALTWVGAFGLVALAFTYFILTYHNPKAHKNMYFSKQKQEKEQKKLINKTRLMLFTFISPFVFTGLLGIKQWADRKNAIDYTFNSIPWQQIYDISKESLNTLRYGKMGTNKIWMLDLSRHDHVESLAEPKELSLKERDALTFISNFSEYQLRFVEISIKDEHFIAVMKLNNQTYAMFDYSESEPFYSSPYIIQKIEDGVFLTIVPDAYVHYRNTKGKQFFVELNGDLETTIFCGLLLLFLVCDFAVLIQISRQSQL